MENNKNKKSVKFQGVILNFYDFIQVFVFTTNHHLKDRSDRVMVLDSVACQCVSWLVVLALTAL